MGKLIINIKSTYKKLSKTEKLLADYFLNNESLLVPYNISELAQITGISAPTINRFAKKIGCNGYQDLKLLIAKEEDHVVQKSINENDTFKNIFHKISEEIYSSIMLTQDSITEEEFKKGYDLIMAAHKIYCFGVGNSAVIGQDICHKLLRVGLDAQPISDSYFQIISACKATKNDLYIAVSHSGYTTDIIESLKIAKENGAKILIISSDKNSPVARLADVSLITKSEEINYRILGLSSRYSQLAIFDTFYSYIVTNSQKARENISYIEESILPKRTAKTKS